MRSVGIGLSTRESLSIMPYSIDIPATLLVLMEELPPRTCSAIYETLERMGALAELWEKDDERWQLLARPDGEGLCFYADGCCVRVEVLPDERRLLVREIGRVLVRLPPQNLDYGYDLPGSHPEH
jgi:hypothetical protein